AAAMLKVGAVKSIEEAFYRYIGNGKPAYMPKSKLSPGEAIELIHGAGGVAVMAHPMIAHMYKHIEDTVKLGLDGIEAYHYSHSRPDIKQLKKTAERFGLLTTGGSDFHGRSEREGEIGSQQVPTRLLAGLRARAEQIRGEA
ncbi:MAG: phosphatase, partial [candidate division Zixibacteria bacterium]|nr:phosphatase [candidate division Zixibacteria bacterium]